MLEQTISIINLILLCEVHLFKEAHHGFCVVLCHSLREKRIPHGLCTKVEAHKGDMRKTRQTSFHRQDAFLFLTGDLGIAHLSFPILGRHFLVLYL